MTIWVALALSLTAAPDQTLDLSGRWARKTINVAQSEVPVLGKIDAVTTAFTLLDVERTVEGYRLQETVCSLNTKSLGGMVQTNYPPAFLRHVSGRTKTVTTADGRWLELEDKPRLHGAANVASDEVLPGRHSKKITDPDHDGKPGLTVKVSGFVSGDVYVVERSKSSMTGTIENRRTIRGTVEWSAEQNVLGASRSALDVAPSVTPASEGNEFEMHRVPANATCAQLMVRADRVFKDKKP